MYALTSEPSQTYVYNESTQLLSAPSIIDCDEDKLKAYHAAKKLLGSKKHTSKRKLSLQLNALSSLGQLHNFENTFTFKYQHNATPVPEPVKP